MGEHHMDEQLFRELFVSWLPNTSQQVLAPCLESLPIEKLAVMADRILSVVTPPWSTSCNRIPSSQRTLWPPYRSRWQHWLQPWKSWPPSKLIVGAASPVPVDAPRSNAALAWSSSSGTTAYDLCFYHSRFSEKARRCIELLSIETLIYLLQIWNLCSHSTGWFRTFFRSICQFAQSAGGAAKLHPLQIVQSSCAIWR